MTKDEFILIIKQFNTDKIKNNWLNLLNINGNCGWIKFKEKIINYPNYYNFKNIAEFKFWLNNSENEDFINKRFCPICGKFIDTIIRKPYLYPSACCEEHIKLVKQQSREKTTFERYGVKIPCQNKEIAKKVSDTWKSKTKEDIQNHITKIKITKKEKYNDENYNNRDAAKATNLEKYGNEYSVVSKEVKNKRFNTNLQRYGNVSLFGNASVREKIKATNLERYGIEIPSKNQEISNKIIQTSIEKYKGIGFGSKEINNKIKKTISKKYTKDEIQEKMKLTNLEKYGVEYPLQNKDIHTKTIETGLKNNSYQIGSKKAIDTKLKKYGSMNNGQKISETKLNWSEEQRQKCIDNIKQTKLEKFCDENYNNREKAKLTCIEKYGVENPSFNSEIKKKIATNAINSRKINGTLNTSYSFEEKLIDYLKETYPQYTILTQYSTDPRYPYCCDCYIKELDLFIEFQGSYFHNYRAFQNTEAHIKEYEDMVAKGGQKATIANVWRYKDVEKRECAKKNNLNYLEYWEKLIILPEDVKTIYTKILYIQQDLFYKQNREVLFDPIERWKYYKNAVEYSNFYAKYGYVSHLCLLKRPYISKQIGYSSFNIKLCDIIDKNKIVYDPCGGWGHRLIGFKKHKHYIYNDINTETKLNCEKLAKIENIDNITFYSQDACLPIKDEYDVVFTCPPYYNKEMFSNKGAENLTEEDFMQWWNTVLQNLHPNDKKVYIVINSGYLKYFTANNYKYTIIKNKIRKSHFHKKTKLENEIIVLFELN